MKLATLAVFALLPALARASDVLAVGPGQQYTSMSAALSAAQPGDVLLLRATFVPGEFIGKGLTVVEDDVWSVTLTPVGSPGQPVLVSSIPAGSVLTLSGMESNHPVQVSGCAGAVRLQNCEFRAGLVITGCADVRLSNCIVRGSMPTNGFGDGSLAISISNSEVVLDHTRVLGSDGGNGGTLSGFPVQPGDGGDGLSVTNSTVLLAGCDVQSGGGGAGLSGTCGSASPPQAGGDAGDALVVNDAASSVSVLDSSTVALQPGLGGFGFPSGLCTQPNGAAGMAVNAPAGTVAYWNGNARWITTFGLAREGQPLQFQVAGMAGDNVVLALSDACTNDVTIYPQGSIGVALPPIRHVLGTIGPNGVETFTITVPELGAGVLGRTYFAQVVCVDTSVSSWFGTPMTLTLLDSSL
jgi:hypothetical protein